MKLFCLTEQDDSRQFPHTITMSLVAAHDESEAASFRIPNAQLLLVEWIGTSTSPSPRHLGDFNDLEVLPDTTVADTDTP